MEYFTLELFLGSFIVFLLCSLALALGQLFGRRPITGNCRSDSRGRCANKEHCSLRCEKQERAQQQTGA
jgi:hypothetical protein